MVKVNCSLCSKEIECPRDMLKTSEKHVCGECFIERRDELSKLGTDKVHVDMLKDDFFDMMATEMTNELVEKEFPKIWSRRKVDLKDMSKKDMACEMFGDGAYTALMSYLKKMKEEAEKEEKNQKE